MPSAQIRLTIAFFSIVVLLILGTTVYHNIEGWDWVDSFYFTGVTVTTVGYGDLYPTHDASKIFTVFLALGGITIVFYSVSVIASIYFERQQEMLKKRLSFIDKEKVMEAQKRDILEHLEGKK